MGMRDSLVRSVLAVPILWVCFSYIAGLSTMFVGGALRGSVVIDLVLLSVLPLIMAVVVVLLTDVRLSAVVVTTFAAGTLASVVLRNELVPHLEGLPVVDAIVGLVIYALLFVPAYIVYRGLAAGTARAVERVRAE